MPWRRKALYLILIAPLHHILSVLASLPAMLMMPPDVILQSLITLPLYTLSLWWVLPQFQRLLRVPTSPDRSAHIRRASLGAGLLALIIPIVAILFGLTTLAEAIVFAAILLISSHAWIIRSL